MRKREFEQLSSVDFVATKTHSSQGESQLHMFEDNEAVMKMIIEGRSPTMRHVSGTTELLLIGCSIESIWTPKIQIKYFDTKKTNLLTS